MTRRNMVDYLPPEKAREDLDVFFTLLRTTYGAYEYFGGDEVFEKLKAESIEILEDTTTPLRFHAYPAGDGPVFAAGGDGTGRTFYDWRQSPVFQAPYLLCTGYIHQRPHWAKWGLCEAHHRPGWGHHLRLFRHEQGRERPAGHPGRV